MLKEDNTEPYKVINSSVLCNLLLEISFYQSSSALQYGGLLYVCTKFDSFRSLFENRNNLIHNINMLILILLGFYLLYNRFKICIYIHIQCKYKAWLDFKSMFFTSIVGCHNNCEFDLA